jgi:sulfoxide reductase heme-binding subunit YedZ
MIGVAAFAYALSHLLLYVTEQSFDFGTIASEIIARAFLTIGFAGLVGLSILAATSTDEVMKYLGGRRWRRLHRLVYAIAVVATFHYLQQSMLGEREPMVMVGLLSWLLLYRLLGATLALGPVGLFSVLLLSIFAAALSALTEAGLIALASGVKMERVLALNFSLELGLRPAWMVVVPGILLACAGVVPRYHATVVLKPNSVSVSPPKTQHLDCDFQLTQTTCVFTRTQRIPNDALVASNLMNPLIFKRT